MAAKCQSELCFIDEMSRLKAKEAKWLKKEAGWKVEKQELVVGRWQ